MSHFTFLESGSLKPKFNKKSSLNGPRPQEELQQLPARLKNSLQVPQLPSLLWLGKLWPFNDC